MLNELFVFCFLLVFMVIGFCIECGFFNKSNENVIFDLKRFPVLTFCFLLFFHDYIFINFNLFFNPNGLLYSTAWKEIFVFVLFFTLILLLFFVKIDREFFSYTFLIFLLFLQGFLSSVLVSNSTILDTLLGARGSIFPFMILVVCFYLPQIRLDANQVINLLFWLVLFPNFLFGLWQYFNVIDVTDLWFYEVFEKKGFQIESYNYFRDGIHRPTGFFVGTLEYGATATIGFIAIFLSRSGKFSILKISTTLIMVYISQSRTFFIGVFLFFIFYLCLFKIKNLKQRGAFATIVIVVLFLTVISFVYFSSDDLSALSRISQWSEAVTSLLNNPLGIGYAKVGMGGSVWPDSLIISYIYIYGVSSVLIFIGMMYLAIISSYLFDLNQQRVNMFPPLALLVFLFFIFFQSLENSPILIFIFIFIVKNIKEIKLETYN